MLFGMYCGQKQRKPQGSVAVGAWVAEAGTSVCACVRDACVSRACVYGKLNSVLNTTRPANLQAARLVLRCLYI